MSIKTAVVELITEDLPQKLETLRNALAWAEPFGIAVAVIAILLTIHQVQMDQGAREDDRATRRTTLYVMALERLDAARLAGPEADRGQIRMLEEMVAAEVRLTGLDASHVNLRNIHLPKAKFESVNFSGTQLEKADLRGAIFDRTNLEGANLREADLTGAVLATPFLQTAEFEYANISGADFRFATVATIFAWEAESARRDKNRPQVPDGIKRSFDWGEKFGASIETELTLENAWYYSDNPPLGISEVSLRGIRKCDPSIQSTGDPFWVLFLCPRPDEPG